MKKLIINGGRKLLGEIEISGSKNATLPIMAASILSSESLLLSNIPHVSDISTMSNILIRLGVEYNLESLNPNKGFEGKVISLNAKNIKSQEALYDLVSKMRASILVLGPLLARFGKARVSLPGGCAIGTRPVDLHLKALEAMGAKILIKSGYVEASGQLHGAEINFDKISVGATQNILMAATIAKGQTIINNAAKEPEIVDLANCLIKMGANIVGAGTSKIIINGIKKLSGASHEIIGDRIEAGTYIIACAITNGELTLKGINLDLLKGIKEKLIEAGIEIKEISKNTLKIKRATKNIQAVNVATSEYPGFPTDIQAQFIALMAIAQGKCEIIENIFENRFMHVLELTRMGAKIQLNGNLAKITGVDQLCAAEIMATDLRASASLVLAALSAKGKSTINRLYHLERGYERLAEKLSSCNADVRIIN
jgi:UDP-N-acetylglucosamine 1-carboxyvinyltransferase